MKMPLKVGVLVPNSNYIPLMARTYPKALELGLQSGGSREFEICVEACGYNADRDTLVEKSQDLITRSDVDVIVAPLNSAHIHDLIPVFRNNQIPLIVNTLGEDVIFADSQDPYIFINSFNMWHAAWITGQWSAQNMGKKASSICSIHDGGYGITFAYALGVEAEDGQLLHATITHRDARDEDPSPQLNEILGTDPEFIMGFYSGKEAISFLNTYDQHHLKDKYPLLANTMMVDESILQEIGLLAEGLKSVSCWNKQDPGNEEFEKSFKEATDQQSNPYALLAWETGKLIADAVDQIEDPSKLFGKMAEALKTAECNSPRGTIKFDPDTREVMTKFYLQQVEKGEDGLWKNRVIEEIRIPELCIEQFNLARKNMSKTGWTNPYLCA